MIRVRNFEDKIFFTYFHKIWWDGLPKKGKENLWSMIRTVTQEGFSKSKHKQSGFKTVIIKQVLSVTYSLRQNDGLPSSLQKIIQHNEFFSLTFTDIESWNSLYQSSFHVWTKIAVLGRKKRNYPSVAKKMLTDVYNRTLKYITNVSTYIMTFSLVHACFKLYLNAQSYIRMSRSDPKSYVSDDCMFQGNTVPRRLDWSTTPGISRPISQPVFCYVVLQ